ncbi:MAG: acetoacetate--CoA ligase [Desulfarculus sp.]|jgi:acetoacetyl-CoA synthetase|nr:MAG: acetoacetate--CoA ligase [Desulfarculus sp.]
MAELLWKPSAERIADANLTRFIGFVNQKYGQCLKDYFDLYDWSIADIPAFQGAIWEFFQVIHSQPYKQVVSGLDKMPGATWFPGARLNFAQNLLRYRDQQPAIVFRSEPGGRRSLTYAELYDQVARLSAALETMGVGPGDRVVGFMPNMPETVVAMLAAVSLGAIWSSCSPDFGFQGVMDRFGQIQPKVLFAADGYFYGGKTFDSLERVARVKAEIKSIEKVVVTPFTRDTPDLGGVPGAVLFGDLLGSGPAPVLTFAQMPFDHPLYILYSSGTTGVPKCMVHGAGNTLVQHLKELALQSDVKRQDKIFYFTTCGWMMWNWLVSSLALGATILLFDGSPFCPGPEVLWQFAQDEGMTIFGTSARYLAAIENEGLKPREKFDLSQLKAVLSTGSPLSIESFRYVYRDIKKDLCLSSISGGSDLVGCFALGNPIGPVYAGQLQARGLGMAMEAWDAQGKPVVGEKAELVCVHPWPSMPIMFWNDPDGSKYRGAYFEVWPNVWFHGDFCEVTPEGGVIMYGRSDATLNPGGVRIGTAEIYRQVESMPEIADSLVIGQDWDNDVRVLLFVKLNPGVILDEALVKKIKTTIRTNCTPRHVPAKVIAIADIPYTISGKKVELAVRNVIHGRPVLNKDALGNPQALDLYADLKELKS